MTSKHQDIEVSYSVSNDFFKLWLDKNMHYTSASYLTGDEDLVQAQEQKAAILHDYGEITPDSLVLDIGCGWGSFLEYIVTRRGVKEAHGVTLSTQQLAWIHDKHLPQIKTWLQDFNTWEPDWLYDAIVSIEMVDHICSPAQARQGKAVSLYRDYFRRAHKLLKPGGVFACQAILSDRVPRNRKDLEDLAFTADIIFPGGRNPRLEELIMAVRPYFEIEELRTQRASYRRTTKLWWDGLKAHQAQIRETFGDQLYEDYDRYLGTCVRCFDQHWSSDVQLKLRRCDI
ncbi:MAG: class I SAM-dependent methyltransferase [Oligoflexia bacterium]|nr:class I SAM-dependent methyltransferase [Oligoflexia bacterium]